MMSPPHLGQVLSCGLGCVFLHCLIYSCVVVGAAVEGAAAALARPDLDDVAAALGAGHAERDGASVLARGVAGAGEELAEAAGLDDHGLAALVAGDVGLLDLRGGAALAEILGALALGVA